MEIKKSKIADLEKRRPTLLLLGLIFSFGITLESFEWLNGNVAIKPISSLADENLYEPIHEVMIVKPMPKIQQSFSSTKRSTKGEVIVKEDPNPITKIIVPVITPVIDPNPAPTGKFDLNIVAPTTREELTSNVPQVDTFGFAAVEEKPEFIGGEEEMIRFLSKNINYPSASRNKGVQGVVYVSFVINEEGFVTNVEIAKGLEKYIDKETLRVINKMPKWKPGKQRGTPVKVKYTIPVNYKLKG